MAISPYKTYVAGEILTAADLNASFSHITTNALALISPLTGTLDANGQELILDGDGDTSITADTDDQIDFKLSGADDFRMTANLLDVLAGSKLKVSGTFTQTVGADVASASALAVDIDGNFFNVTGTTAITSMNSKGVGTEFTLRFTDVLTLTHHSTDLVLPNSANITTAVGDIARFYEYASGDVRLVNYQRAAVVPYVVVQAVEATPYTTYNSTAAAIPADDTIPQIGEGDEIITVTITPKRTTNRLVIEALIQCNASATTLAVAALFQDATANALAAQFIGLGSTLTGQIVLRHEMAAGTTSSTTFRIRVGTTAGNLFFNGGGSSRLFGGTSACRLRVTEIEA